ncbi:MAG: hypothetical protein PHV20_12030 [Bacteroidales bacterium]|nr:hypothetical protein [Bacteroidales bacterium]
MKKVVSLFFMFVVVFSVFSKTKSISDNGVGISIGGYAQMDYNQPIDANVRQNGTLDVHRMVLLLGYRFDARTQFVTELEWEHINEVGVEQAFVQYKLSSSVNLKAGQILIPMGLINEFHEPLAYNGVERPIIDKVVAPTTWTALGAGATGLLSSISLKYQIYLINGISTYGDEATIGGSGIRNARQEGTSFISSPTVSLKADYFGLKNLQLGAALYAGKTHSTLYNNLKIDDKRGLAIADSSVVNLTMIGLDAKYRIKSLQLKAQYYYSWISNTDSYNAFSGKDLGSEILGWYLEAGYNVLSHFNVKEKELTPFLRVEQYDTHHKVGSFISVNPKYNNQVYTTGIGLKLNKNVVIKTDVQFIKSKNDNQFAKTFNAGVGVTF